MEPHLAGFTWHFEVIKKPPIELYVHKIILFPNALKEPSFRYQNVF